MESQQERESLGKRFQEERERLGLGRQQLAESAGYSAEQVRVVEAGKKQPGALLVRALGVLGGDVSYVLVGVRSCVDTQRLSVICHAIEEAVAERFGVKGHCNPRMLGQIYNQVLAKGRTSDDDVKLAKEEVAQFLDSLRALDMPDEQLAKSILRQGGEAPKGISVTGSGHQVAGRDVTGIQINSGRRK